MSFITALGTANPPHRFSQPDIADFMVRAMQLDHEGSRKLKTIFRASGISYRHSVLEDYGKTNDFSFYPEDSVAASHPSTGARMAVFREHAVTLSAAAVNNLSRNFPDAAIREVTHLIVVSCTGMYAPGLDIDLVHALGLSNGVQRTAINFMGCQAGINALKVADALCRARERSRVLIVCTELCSIHFQRDPSEDNLIANALFGDGSAALLVENESQGALRLLIEDFHSDLIQEGAGDMAWTIGDAGFQMRLSTFVPDLIKDGIAGLAAEMLKKVRAGSDDIRHYAIHPGGKRILEALEKELKIGSRQSAPAYEVLRQYGNMSSPSVLFVLQEIVRTLTSVNEGERIMAFAFGPGLTVESMVLKVDRAHA